MLQVVSEVTSFSAFMLAAFIVVLTGATVYYAIQTGRLVIETKRMRVPRIRADLEPYGPNQAKLVFKNIGLGAAEDVNIVYNTAPLSEQRTWHQNVLSAGDSVAFLLDQSRPSGPARLDTMRDFADKFEKITISGSYKDIFGETYELTETLDLKRYQRERERDIRITHAAI